MPHPMAEQISILFFCRNFHRMAGGVERMSTLIMNQMVRRGFRVGLVTWDPADAEPHYHLDPSIAWAKLDLGSPENRAGWALRLQRQLALRRIAKQFKPDVSIGFQVGTFIAARTAMLGMGIPMIAAERNSPDLFDFVSGGQKQRRRANLALAMANCVTVQFDSYRDKYPARVRRRIVTIPNPVLLHEHPAYPNEVAEPPRSILNVGRLSYQKNQVLLVRAFARIATAYPDWVLTLVGEGEKRADIERLIAEKGLSNRIELIGAVTDVDAWYRKSAFLAFPSLWEGFPNALVEAFRQGLPAVGLGRTAGVNELLRHDETGILAPNDEVGFAAALQTMIDDLEFRQRAGRMARESILRYEPESIFNQWADLFTTIAGEKR
jgi:GalNAc-alpha-(1->4)-GalNAc-alpha-(1->3)-diNAcBac-PP-undecaprenol alpha-1,4-N-acetyl-D-galactosaminyltransferase